MINSMLPLPGLSPVSGKSVVAKFDGGLLSSDGGVLMLREFDQRLRVADANSLRADPMFKMAHDLASSDGELCSQSTISRLENLPDTRTLLRMGRAMVDLCCASFKQVPKCIVLDIDDTFDAVHGGQQLRLFNARYDEYGLQPIVVFDGGGRFIAAVLRPGRRARSSAPSYAASCARSAPTGRRRKSCRQPLLLPRGSRLGAMVSTTFSASHPPRRCASISKRWKPT